MDTPVNQGLGDRGVIETADQASAFLESLLHQPKPDSHRIRERFGQQALLKLLARVGDPQRGLRIIHIAGSKGKGSTALLTEAILLAAGRRTGTFISPHLQRWTERFRIDGQEVSDELFAAAVERLRPHILALRAKNIGGQLTFFDAITATALLLFQDAGVELAIMEAGLGGRLDATNIVEPRVVCITSIELEHVDRLGSTLEEIAREKAAIIKPGIPTVTGNLPPVAALEVLDRAKAMGAPLVRLNRELQVRFLSKDIEGFELSVTLGNLKVDQVQLPLLGQHAVHNSAIAAACVYLLDMLPTEVVARATRNGLATAQLPGRIEVLAYQPWVVVDSAHTGSSAQALAAALERIPARRAHLVLSISSGKNLEAICRALLPDFERVTATRAQPGRSLPPEELEKMMTALRPGLRVDLVEDPLVAVQAAYKTLGADDLLCIAGSVYMAGRGRQALVEEIDD